MSGGKCLNPGWQRGVRSQGMRVQMMHGTGVDTDWADLPLFRWNRQLQLSVSSGQTGTNAGIGPIGPRDPPVWPDVGRTDAGSELWLELRGKSPGAAVSIGLPEKNYGPAAWVFQPEIGTDISVVSLP